MVELTPIPDHYRSKEKREEYISKWWISWWWHMDSDYNKIVKDILLHNPYIKSISWCDEALTNLLLSLKARKCLFIVDKNDHVFVLKTQGELWVFDLSKRKFGRFSNDIYIYLINEYVNYNKKTWFQHIRVPYILDVKMVDNETEWYHWLPDGQYMIFDDKKINKDK